MNKSQLTICMFSNLYPPIVSGSSTQTSTLARELVRRGCRVVVITAKVDPQSPDMETIEGVHVYRLPATRLPRMPIAFNFPWLSYTFTPRNLRRIYRIIEQYSPDVFHLHNHMFDLALASVLASRRVNKPLVVTIHTVFKHKRFLFNLLLYPIDRLILRQLVIRQATSVICPDINIEEYVGETFGAVNTQLVPYGIDIPEKASQRSIESIRIKHGLDDRRVLLSIGHLHAIRNRKDIVEALPIVLAEHPNTVLLILGMVGDDTPMRLARELRIQEAVILAGPVPHSDLPAYLALADMEAHWMNQEKPEKTSLGIASLEAMAAGKVILAAANEETYGPDVLRNGDNFILVEPGNPRRLAQTMIDLLNDGDRRAAIGEQARETIESHFSWDSVCARTIEVYQTAQRRFVEYG
jgi:glycosyltransferase involved in cell wall biosynthesis